MELKLQNLTKGNVKPVEDPMYVPQHFQSFLYPGLNAMMRLVTNIEPYTKEQYFQTLNWVVGLDWRSGRGALVLLKDEQGETVGYAAAYENSAPFSIKKNLHVFALYSQTNNTQQTIQLMDFAKRYAAHFGYHSISGNGGRLKNSRRRFWYEKLGFKISYIGFIYHV